jgi:hypothetical protein
MSIQIVYTFLGNTLYFVRENSSFAAKHTLTALKLASSEWEAEVKSNEL